MLAEERSKRIIELVNERGSVTVTELMEQLGASESTIRRALNALDAMGELIKVYGGAMSNTTSFKMRDDEVDNRRVMNMEQKKQIARYAAGLVRSDDLVYIDAGTTTEYISEYITEKGAIYVTNAVTHAHKLVKAGCEVYLIGGRLKSATEAIVGAKAIEMLGDYNFTIGFWGTNGISKKNGFTTPDAEEAGVKRASFENCKKPYVLADSTKFDSISPVKFADFEEAVIITDSTAKGYEQCKNIIISPEG